MKVLSAVVCLVLVLAAPGAGCLSRPLPATGTPEEPGIGGTTFPPAGVMDGSSPAPTPAGIPAAVYTTAVPLLLTDAGRVAAGGCGWTEAAITESAAFLLGCCSVRALIDDGWLVAGITYRIDTLGSPCRRSIHPGAPEDCDWCDSAGPVLVLRYRGIAEAEYIADMTKKTVSHLSTKGPEGSGFASTGGSSRIVLGNGTVLYTFRDC